MEALWAGFSWARDRSDGREPLANYGPQRSQPLGGSTRIRPSDRQTDSRDGELVGYLEIDLGRTPGSWFGCFRLRHPDAAAVALGSFPRFSSAGDGSLREIVKPMALPKVRAEPLFHNLEGS